MVSVVMGGVAFMVVALYSNWEKRGVPETVDQLLSLATVMGPPRCHEHGTTVGRC